jgi:tetratricopeptide (TPR) repeat protein
VPEPVQPAVDPQPAASQQMAAPTQTVSLLPEDNDEAPNADGPELPLPQKRQRARLLYQAKNFAQAQEYDKAISRLEGVLALVPEDQETKALLTSYQAKQNEVAQTAAQRQEAMNRIRVQIDSVVAQAKERLHTKQFDEASALLAQLSDPTTDYPELARDYAKVGQMEKKIAEARQLVLTQQQEALSAEEAAKEAVRRAYQQGIQAYEEKNFTQAMAHLELAANSDIDVPETALAASYLKGLKDSMDSGIQADVDRGFALYRIQDYPGALRVWSRVLKFFPDHPDVRPIFDTIQPIQTEKARHIYQEGLVYEGIDNIDLAKQKWNEVLKVLPVEESEYYSKAKEKLAAYGQSDE